MAFRRMSVLRVAHFQGFTAPSCSDSESSATDRLSWKRS